MNRRAAERKALETGWRFGCSLLVAVLAFGAPTTVADASVSGATFDVEVQAVDAGTEPEPPTTANDFFPEERDLTDCIGVLERPGCGSESRGGWRQSMVLAAIALGLGVVFFNVIRGVRQRTQT